MFLRTLVLFAVIQCVSFSLCGQETATLHEFTDKKGQKISATLISVSADRKLMKIRREDGQEFETAIVLLSLEDQQYIKSWMSTEAGAAALASPKAEYRVDLSVSRQSGRTEKHTNNSYILDTKETFFRIALRNISRETLESARVEYAVVWDDGVIFYEIEKNDWGFTYPNVDVSMRVKIDDAVPLEAMRFNGELTLETKPVGIDQLSYSGNIVYREDELVGIKVRVLSEEGTIINEAHSGSAGIASLEWDEIMALPAPKKIN